MNRKHTIKLITIDKDKLSKILNCAYGGDCVTVKSFNFQETITFYFESSDIIENDPYNNACIIIEILLKKYKNEIGYLIKNYNIIDFIKEDLPNDFKISNLKLTEKNLIDISEEYDINYNLLKKLFYPKSNNFHSLTII